MEASVPVESVLLMVVDFVNKILVLKTTINF
jgi:hypothetical protein